MSSSNNNNNTTNRSTTLFPKTNPYVVLGVPITATDSEIAKAYRQLARTLHPDKQQQQQQQKQQQKQQQQSKTNHDEALIKERFHEVQIARSFLLDSEYNTVREQYKKYLLSQQERTKYNERTEQQLSDRRKRMRDELYKQEQLAKNATAATTTTATATLSKQDNKYKHNKTNDLEHDDYYKSKKKTSSSSSKDTKYHQLKKEGQKLRENYRNQQETKDEQALHEQIKQQQSELEKCQIRMKWSRKKLLQEYNHLQSVNVTIIQNILAKDLPDCRIISMEVIGSKDNTALVTFDTPLSATKVVEYYLNSNSIRATYISSSSNDNNPTTTTTTTTTTTNVSKDTDEWKLQRQIERERLVQQMEFNENNNNTTNRADTTNDNNDITSKTTTIASSSSLASKRFPPPFPPEDYHIGDDNKTNLSPYQILCQFDEPIVHNIISNNSSITT